jgi:uncharacterized protein DUF6262
MTDEKPAGDGQQISVDTPLTQARRRHSEQKRAAVLAAVTRVVQAGEPVSISGVANLAGVSRQFIYSNEMLMAKVEGAREIQRDAGISGLRASGNTLAGSAAMRMDLLLAQQEIARLRKDNARLRTQLRQHLGVTLEARSDQRASEQLVRQKNELSHALAERDALQAKVDQLEGQLQLLNDELTAERRAHAATMRAMTLPANVTPIR